jgi:hypothetical protein
MGYRYENKLDEENERNYLQSLSWSGRVFHRVGHWLFMLLGSAFAFYCTIGWLILKLF